MRSPYIQALLDEHQYALLTEDKLDDFLQVHENVVLLFTENPKHFPESNDVAVILPQLMSEFVGRLTAAVIDEAAERPLHKRYAFNRWPALVFLRRGEYLGVIAGMQNWSDFRCEFERLLASTPVQAPAFTLPIVAETTSGCQ